MHVYFAWSYDDTIVARNILIKKRRTLLDGDLLISVDLIRWRQHWTTYTVARSSTVTSSRRTFLSGRWWHLTPGTASFQQSSSWPTTASVELFCRQARRVLLGRRRSWRPRLFSTMERSLTLRRLS